jgi:hypothetical protein
MWIRLEEPTKFVAVDEQTNNQIMHPFRLGPAGAFEQKRAVLN